MVLELVVRTKKVVRPHHVLAALLEWTSNKPVEGVILLPLDTISANKRKGGVAITGVWREREKTKVNRRKKATAITAETHIPIGSPPGPRRDPRREANGAGSSSSLTH